MNQMIIIRPLELRTFLDGTFTFDFGFVAADFAAAILISVNNLLEK